jgi:polysaccharide pyruvyl transferase WcaK-like protein/MoaA/NifB/PqqE/SkfB family radical SAM enzyme
MNIKSIINILKYLPSKRPFPIEKPIVLQIPVIDICNSRCQMCRIWENKKSDDILPEQLRAGLKNSLYSKVEAVGLNGGEPTLRKDLGEIASVLFEELPSLISISLITNAYKYEQVINRIEDVGKVVSKHGGVLDVMVSLDGFGEMHDKVRGKPGNFERAQNVIDFALSSPLVNSVRIGCTIIKENIYGLSDLFEFCQSKNLYIKYRLGIPHQRLYTKNLVDPYALNLYEKYHIVEFLEGLINHYEKSEHQIFFYRSLIDQIMHEKPRKAGCDWQHRGATITSKGELLYCAVESKSLGNIVEQDSNQLYFENKDHLDEIIRDHCDTCNHDYVGIPPREQYIKQLTTMVADKLKVKNYLITSYRALKSNNFIRAKKFNSRIADLKLLGSNAKSWPNNGHTRILICGWYGTETLGDKGILGGILKGLRSYYGEIDVTLVSLNSYVSQITSLQMNEMKRVRIVSPDDGVKLASNADLVIFGGGPLMAIDETAEILAIFETAKLAGRKTILAGCGVGPLGTNFHNKAITKILDKADARIYRDEQGKLMAKSLGINTQKDIVAEDPAFTWLKGQEELVVSHPCAEQKVLLLGLRDFPYETYARDLNESEAQIAKSHYEQGVINALESLINLYPDLIIKPLPMCTNHYGDDDRWFYRRLFRGNEIISNNLDESLLGAELAPIEYCKAFKEATVALTMRFHSLVFALGLDLPAVTIDYTLGRGKVYALAERFGVPYCKLNELESDFIVDEVVKLFKHSIQQAPNYNPVFTSSLHRALDELGFQKN